VNERLLRAREVAEALDVSPETMLRWTRRGDLPAVRLPSGGIRYRPDELAGWLDSRATATPSREVSATPLDAAGDHASVESSATPAATAATTEKEDPDAR
jgi:excisionase family DNA binding protein